MTPDSAALPAPADPAIRCRRIAVVINSLGTGGAERVVENILRTAPPGAWDCHLVLLDREQTERRTPPGHVTVHRLDCDFGLFESILQLRAVLQRIEPDLVVSFLVRANVAAIIASRSIGAPCIISERAQLTAHLAGRYPWYTRWAAWLMPRLLYPLADHVIAVSAGVRSDLVSRFGVAPDRASSIPNPFDLERIAQEAEAEPELPLPDRFIVSVGRLVGSKGFNDLIEAYARASPDASLCILGEGPERERLENRLAASGLDRKVRLLGYARNPFAIVGRAELFVSASRCEGFPNAMAEAMALGVPVVATDCPSGPAEILDGVESTECNTVHEGRYGVLVPVLRPDALALAIRLMEDAGKRQHYSELARRRMGDFRIDTIARRYWSSFEAALAAHDARDAGRRARREVRVRRLRRWREQVVRHVRRWAGRERA
jgi:glycosyltransferase involved in cell wall biosynthesis